MENSTQILNILYLIYLMNLTWYSKQHEAVTSCNKKDHEKIPELFVYLRAFILLEKRIPISAVSLAQWN